TVKLVLWIALTSSGSRPSAAFACCARNTVAPPCAAWKSADVGSPGAHESPGYAPNSAYRSLWAVLPASITCHAGSEPRGPRFVFVSGPCAQNPKNHRDDCRIIHPLNAMIRTRYAIHRPNTAASRTYTL